MNKLMLIAIIGGLGYGIYKLINLVGLFEIIIFGLSIFVVVIIFQVLMAANRIDKNDRV